jgi:hypothetical protein
VEPIIKLGLKHVMIPHDTTDDEIADSFERFKHRIGWTYLMAIQNLSTTSDKPDNKFKTAPKPFHFSGIYQKPLDILQETIDSLMNWKDRHKVVSNHNHTYLILQNLRKDPEIIFKPSDKNLGLTCLNTIDYHNLVMNHLNTSEYQKLGVMNETRFFDTTYQRTKRAFIKLLNDIVLPLSLIHI